MSIENQNENAASNSLNPPQPPAVPTIPPAPPRVRRLRSRVARLPLEIRNLVSQALRDGASYAEIIALLAAHGFPGFTPTLVVGWVKRGYRDWRQRQERLELSQKGSDRIAALLGRLREDGRCELADVNEWLLAAQLNDALAAIDGDLVRNLLAAEPAEFFRLARAVVGQSGARALRQQADLGRLKYELEMRKTKERERRRAEPGGVDPAEMARIHAKINLM